MAGFTYVVAASGTTGTSGTIIPVSVKQTGRSVTIKEVSFSAGGTAVAAALAVSLNIYSSASSGGGTVAAGKWLNQSIPAATSNYRTLDTTPGTIVTSGPSWQIQPLGGIVDVQYPLDAEAGMDSATSDYIGIAVINNGTSYPFSSYMIIEEK